MLCPNAMPGYAVWFLRSKTVTAPQEILTQQNPIANRYCMPQATGGTPSFWGWPASIGKKRCFVPFAFIDKTGNSNFNWQFGATEQA